MTFCVRRLAVPFAVVFAGVMGVACEEPGADFGAPCTSDAECPSGFTCFLAPSGEGACFQVPGEDSGPPPPSDGGFDSGPEPPEDGGFDSGPEPPVDGGFDAGFDSGPEPYDAGPGTDAGPPSDNARLSLERTRHHLTISLGEFQAGGLTLRGRVVPQAAASLSGDGLTLTGRITQLGPEAP